MAIEKLDHLFKEKSREYKPTPHPDSWQKVSERIHHKNKYGLLWRVAAMILLGLGLGWVLYPSLDNSENKTAQSITVDHPPVNEEITFTWNIPQPPAHPVGKVRIPAQVTKQKSIGSKEEKMDVILPDIEMIRIARLEVNISLPAKVKLNTDREAEVVIKYYANATNPPTGASSSKFKQIITYASNNTPAEIIGDIREAKNEFISSKLKID